MRDSNILKMIGWSKQESKWLPVSTYHQDYELLISDGGERSYFPTMLEVQLANGEYVEYDVNNGFPIRRFTGLKDTNGVEIYEGDIVEVIEDIKTSGRVQDDGTTLWNVIDKGLRFEVDWNDMSPRFELYPIPLDTSEIDMDRIMIWLWNNDGGDECLKVIGNIYQNPELIK